MFGADKFKEILEQNKDKQILLYGDPDCDGLISLLLMCRFCDMLGLKYSYYVNNKRSHGFEIPMSSLRSMLVIAADFTITEKQMQNLVDHDITVLSTDHHEVQSTFIDCTGVNGCRGIVINNQYPFEPKEDRYLSGAGVFYELICQLYPNFESKENKALVGITLLSDIREIENQKAKGYLRCLYSIDTNSGYAKYLIDELVPVKDGGFGVPKLDRNFIDFTLSPRINALLRADMTNTAVQFILGYGLGTADARQLQRDLIATMKERAQICDFPHCTFIVVNASDFTDFNVDVTGYIGLLCSNVKDGNGSKSTLGVVVENGIVTRASFRGRYDDVHYRSGFISLDINAQGHPNAFGIKDFRPENDTWFQIDDVVAELEENHKATHKVIKAPSLAFILVQQGAEIATNNCYVRDMYRTYIKYTGNNAKLVRKTYKTEELSSADYATGVKPDVVSNGVNYKYVRDASGEPVVKYMEYLVDGRPVKSFGVALEDGLILPILERGYITLYVRPNILD